MSEWNTVQEVADRYKVSRQFVYERIHSGEWPHTKLGKRTYRFSDAHLGQIEEGAAAPPTKITAIRRRRAREATRRIV